LRLSVYNESMNFLDMLFYDGEKGRPGACWSGVDHGSLSWVLLFTGDIVIHDTGMLSGWGVFCSSERCHIYFIYFPGVLSFFILI
jgi:hypothetical protein